MLDTFPELTLINRLIYAFNTLVEICYNLDEFFFLTNQLKVSVQTVKFAPEMSRAAFLGANAARLTRLVESFALIVRQGLPEFCRH